MNQFRKSFGNRRRRRAKLNFDTRPRSLYPRPPQDWKPLQPSSELPSRHCVCLSLRPFCALCKYVRSPLFAPTVVTLCSMSLIPTTKLLPAPRLFATTLLNCPIYHTAVSYPIHHTQLFDECHINTTSPRENGIHIELCLNLPPDVAQCPRSVGSRPARATL